MTAATMPGEDRIDRGPELETEAKPHKVICHAAREHTHQKLKMRTSESPILRLPDVIWSLILLVVALCIGIGAVLLQGDSAGEKRPIAFASRKLQPRESRYSTIERECLAIVWGGLSVFSMNGIIRTLRQSLRFRLFGGQYCGPMKSGVSADSSATVLRAW